MTEQNPNRVIFNTAKEVYEGKLPQIDGINILVRDLNMNRGSAQMIIIQIFPRLLDGEQFTRTLSVELFNSFLRYILEDYGADQLRKSLSALKMHIDYSNRQGDPKIKLKKIYTRYLDNLNLLDNDEFSIMDETEQSEKVNISPTEKKVLAKYRLQQSKYRKELLLYWEGCSITKCLNSSLLIASHIKPYSEAEDHEKYDLDNGLILTPTLDKLFDRYLASFNDDGTIMLSKSLKNTDLKRLKITGEEVLRKEKITPGMLKYLNHHRQKFEQEENKVTN